MKEVALKVLNNVRVYITRVFAMDPDDVIMESQCTKKLAKLEDRQAFHLVTKYM